MNNTSSPGPETLIMSFYGLMRADLRVLITNSTFNLFNCFIFTSSRLPYFMLGSFLLRTDVLCMKDAMTVFSVSGDEKVIKRYNAHAKDEPEFG